MLISFSIGFGVCQSSKNFSMSESNFIEIVPDEENINQEETGNIKERNNKGQATQVEQAIPIYQEFLEGKISSKEGYNVDGMTIPTGEPEKRYSTRYAFFDSTGDGIPELHVDAARYYYVFAYRNGELIRWLDLSPYPSYYALTSGAFISYRPGGGPDHDDYCYYVFNYSGDVVLGISFSRYDENENFTYDDEDEYLFDGVKVTKEVWYDLTNEFIYRDENGDESFRDEIEWTVLYE